MGPPFAWAASCLAVLFWMLAMTEEAEKGLERIVAAAKINVDLLLDATKRPEVSALGVSRMALENLLESIAAVARMTKEDAGLSAATRIAIGELLASYEEYRRRTIDVHEHLPALARGWACAACKKTSAKDAAASGVRSANATVELVCKACGAKTPLTREGKQHLKEIFGAAMTPAWNPTANGFLWDGR